MMLTTSNPPIVRILSSAYPQVKQGGEYTVRYTNEHGMVFLMGITNPVPLSICEYIARSDRTNQFVETRILTIVQRLVVENAVGSSELRDVMMINETVVDSSKRFSEYTDNVSNHILNLVDDPRLKTFNLDQRNLNYGK